MIRRQADLLRALGGEVFHRAGAPKHAAYLVATSLVEANLLGHDSHGILRISRYVRQIQRGELDPAATPAVREQRGAVATVDGYWSFGQITAREGVRTVAELAQTNGVGTVALANVNHVGRLGEYVDLLAQQGLVAMAIACGARQGGTVAAFGGRESVFGTNPMAWSLPVGPNRPPLVVDFSTAIIPEGKVAVAKSKGEALAQGILLDKEGNPSTNPNHLYEGGALRPFGGHKGYGLSLMIELIATLFCGFAPASSSEWKSANATVFCAWRLEDFVARDRFDRLVEELLHTIKSSKPEAGFQEVLLPGEPEAAAKKIRSSDGIPVPISVWHELTELAEEIGVDREYWLDA